MPTAVGATFGGGVTVIPPPRGGGGNEAPLPHTASRKRTSPRRSAAPVPLVPSSLLDTPASGGDGWMSSLGVGIAVGAPACLLLAAIARRQRWWWSGGSGGSGGAYTPVSVTEVGVSTFETETGVQQAVGGGGDGEKRPADST